MYSKFIEKGELVICIGDKDIVKPQSINADKINECDLLDGYHVVLYKGKKNEKSGIDMFINDYMIYDREKSKEKVKWNLLNESKHSYKDCIVEINYYGEMRKFIDNKNELFTQVIDFIKENRTAFLSKTISIQYDMDIEKVDDLEEYYDENSAKSIGIKAFNKLYEDFLCKKDRF